MDMIKSLKGDIAGQWVEYIGHSGYAKLYYYVWSERPFKFVTLALSDVGHLVGIKAGDWVYWSDDFSSKKLPDEGCITDEDRCALALALARME